MEKVQRQKKSYHKGTKDIKEKARKAKGKKELTQRNEEHKEKQM